MDLDEIRSILQNSNATVWEIIDAAVTLAATDYASELKHRRDGIVERLYTQQCSNCDVGNINVNINSRQQNDVVPSSLMKTDEGFDSPYTPHSVAQDEDGDDDVDDVDVEEEEDVPDRYAGVYRDDHSKILLIKEQLEDPQQSDEDVVELLQTLADMDLTFTVLKETDIGRHVNQFRKHRSNEVRSLVKQLVRKWKDLVDEWVGSNNGASAPATLTYGDSPVVQNVHRSAQNGHHQVPDFGYSPNPNNGSSGSERNNTEPEQRRAKPVVSKQAAPLRPAPQSRPASVGSASASAPPKQGNKEQIIDPDRLASARKRLHDNYQEVNNAKKNRTIQVMDIHEIPKPRNGFIAKNKGNFHGRHR